LYPDSNELDKYWKGFQEWNINLQDFVDDNSVNLTDISRLTIGFGNKTAGGTGTVYFDNIRLYPPRCVRQSAFADGSLDFDEDCLVDNADLDVFTQRDWLVSAIGNTTATAPSDPNRVAHWPMDDDDPQLQVDDISGNANHGTLSDEDKIPGRSTSAHSVDGYITKALSLDGVDDYIEIPALNLNSNTVTISAWIKRDGDLPMYAGILMCYYTDPCDANLSTWAGLTFGSGGSRGFGEWDPWEINHELAYFWHMDANDTPLALYDDHAWDWHSGLVVPDDQWVLAALVVEPTQGTLYMYDGTLYASRNRLTHYPELWNGLARIGDQVEVPDRLFKGAIDDVRVYDYSLTPEEVLYTALQGAGSQYIELPWWRADYNDDNTINFTDYSVVADNWLKEILFP
ncbi:MAG: LamG domain-containing protein, partial [Planctomycetota bacterium]